MRVLVSNGCVEMTKVRSGMDQYAHINIAQVHLSQKNCPKIWVRNGDIGE